MSNLHKIGKYGKQIGSLENLSEKSGKICSQ